MEIVTIHVIVSPAFRATSRDHYPLCCWSQKFSVTFFLKNHAGQLPDICHRASLWRTVTCKTISNLWLVNFLYAGTLNNFDMCNTQVTHVLRGRLNTKCKKRI